MVDKNQKNKMILNTIKKMIRAEVKLVLKDIIAEEIEKGINKLLAERFIANMQNNNSVLSETLIDGSIKPKRSPPQQFTPEQLRQKREQARKDAMRKLGIDGNSTMAQIYEDVDLNPPRPANMPPGAKLPTGEYVDSEDEGVDLSQFGL